MTEHTKLRAVLLFSFFDCLRCTLPASDVCNQQDGKFVRRPNAEKFTLNRREGLPAELPHGENVKTVVQEMSKGGKSLFSQAILSERTVAVKHVYRLILKLFGETHPEV